jgi:hypothetical protein
LLHTDRFVTRVECGKALKVEVAAHPVDLGSSKEDVEQLGVSSVLM